jgi:drug/metabolite transporter (DMT)-like permease
LVQPAHPFQVFGAFSLLGFLAASPLAVPQLLSNGMPQTPRIWSLLLLVAVSSMVAQLLMTFALGYVKAAYPGIANQLSVIFAVVAGVWFFSEPWSWLTLCGGALTILGVIWALVRPASTRPESMSLQKSPLN